MNMIEIGRRCLQTKVTLGETSWFLMSLASCFLMFFLPIHKGALAFTSESFCRWREFWIRCISSATGWLECIGAAALVLYPFSFWPTCSWEPLLPALATWNLRCIMYQLSLTQAATSVCFDFATRTAASFQDQILMWVVDESVRQGLWHFAFSLWRWPVDAFATRQSLCWKNFMGKLCIY